MSCPSVRRLLLFKVDGVLDVADEAAVATHLAQCERCLQYGVGLQLTAGALEGLQRVAAPLDLHARIVAELRLRRSRRGRWGFPVAIAAAALAGLLVSAPRWQGTPVAARQPLAADQVAADQATAEFMHWMDPAADGGTGLVIQQAAFDTEVAAPRSGSQGPEASPGR